MLCRLTADDSSGLRQRALGASVLGFARPLTFERCSARCEMPPPPETADREGADGPQDHEPQSPDRAVQDVAGDARRLRAHVQERPAL